MAIPESFIQELLSRIDIVNVIDACVPLKKSGANYVACCPFHNEKTPSFTVSPSKQFYHCFGCGAHGSAIGFLMEYHGMGFVEAVHELAKRAGLSVPQDSHPGEHAAQKTALTLHHVLQQASHYYRAQLKQSERAIAYLKGRGLSGEIAARFQLGYAPPGWQHLKSVFSNYQSDMLSAAGLVIDSEQGRRYDRFRDRVMFPIHDRLGQVIGFGGRLLGNEGEDSGPKYLNSPETPLFQKGRELYGLFLARRTIREAKRVVVVEGYMDVVALAQYGIGYAVATLGTATTPSHIAQLMRQTDDIVFCFDGDAAGRQAAWRAAINSLPAMTDGLKVSFLFLPAEHDPDSFVRAHGRAGFEAALKQAQPLSHYLLNTLCEQNDMQTPEGRVRFLHEAAPMLKQIQAPALGLLLRKRVAELAGIAQTEMERLLSLGAPSGRPPAPARSNRRPPTLTRWLLQILLLQPHLAAELPAELIHGSSVEADLLRQLRLLATTHPELSCAALLEALRTEGAPPALLAELSAEVMQIDVAADFAQELRDAVAYLRAAQSQRDLSVILKIAQEHGLQALSAEQKAMLQRFRRGAV